VWRAIFGGNDEYALKISVENFVENVAVGRKKGFVGLVTPGSRVGVPDCLVPFAMLVAS
jgi:hypothetical protein